MGIHVEPHINDYWNTNEDDPIHQLVRKTMSNNRWKQIDRYFHIWDPASDQHCARPDKVRPHEKVDPLWKLLSPSFQRYWKPGRDVTVDECIEGFTGRASDTVNIPTKPTPIGFKIWVLADQGYVFDLLWHVKGDKKDQGPQGLRSIWEEKGFSKTQAVVLELMTRMPNGGKGHAVHIDNLFTSSKLLSTLRDYGIGAAGTVRTSKTKREENEEKRKKQQLELYEIPQDQDQLKDQDLPQDLDPLQDLDSLQDLDLPQNGHLQPALDLIQEIKEDLDQNLIPQKTSQDRTRAKKPEKEKNFGMNEKLIELKTKWSNHIAWGKLYGCLSSDKNVLQLAWQDSQIVLFMTTIVEALTTV